MVSVNTDRLIDDYLRRVEAAAGGLAPAPRAELVAEIREHIDSALRAADTADEVAVRNVLERLGPPEDIAREAPDPVGGVGNEGRPVDGRDLAALAVVGAGFLVPFLGLVSRRLLLGPLEIASLAAWAAAVLFIAWRLVTRAPSRGRGGGVEIAAIVLLTIGGFTWPLWAWLAGNVLVWLSGAWATRQKLAVPLLTLLLLPVGWSVTTPSHGLDVVLRETAMFALSVGGLFGGIYLGYRLVRPSRKAQRV
jgi:hypothetical protein